MSMNTRFLALLLSVLAWLGLAGIAFSQTSTERIVSSGQLSRPVFVTAPPGDTDRLFIAEQHTGRIEILDLNTGSLLNSPFI